VKDASDFGVLLGLAYGNFVAEMRAALAEEGFGDLHRSFGYVARLLDEREASIKELADLLGLTSQGAVKVVDELQADGYVRRVSDPSDGRVRRVQLTERGREALGRARAFHARFEAGLAERMGPSAAGTIRSALTELAHVDESGATASAIRPM
jgi:DNA-binding MarR family transcriptional regulator